MAAAPDIKAKVYQAICQLTRQHSYARRDAIINLTGLKFSLVDEAVKSLREEDLTINRIKGGFFTPVKVFEEFPPGVTVLDDGRYKLEHGDEMMTVTPRAASIFAVLLAGAAVLNGRMLPMALEPQPQRLPSDTDSVAG